MGPSSAVKNGMRDRYYVSAAAVQGRRADAGSVDRMPAPDLEATALDALALSGKEVAWRRQRLVSGTSL